ncbi:MAG TPA: heparan-alpha-glucosaminide N-acetyltransferase domain-containing protein [Blastocatellia bacterium]|nr:heparan-alpha-glucosaminide N-acetyltransferase domain-containing protein [Blastocatellia bacterium]
MTAAVAEEIAHERDCLPQTGRLVSLDVFRGLTVAAMILVNNPGSWNYIYAPLEHAEWNGWTPTDLIFPFFLFIVGVAITFSIGGKVERGTPRRRIIGEALRRSLKIYAIGFFLASFPFFHLSRVRIPGVLARIAVCFLCASLIFLFTSARGQALIAAALLLLYWVLMKAVPVPGDYVQAVIERGGNLEKEANLAAYVDYSLLKGHLWSQSKFWDPEGLLSTIPAIATVLLGILAGHWIKSERPARQKLTGLIVGGVAAIIVGEVMNRWFPINKNLWTSSYVVFTAGWALLLLALCYWLADLRGYRRAVFPFVVFGMNALAVFALSGLVARLLGLIKESTTQPDGTVSYASLQSYYYERFFASWAGPLNGSLAFAVAFVLLMYWPMHVLYRKRVFIKV